MTDKVSRPDLTAYYIPCSQIADEVGNPKVSNMVMLGAYVAGTKVLKPETIEKMIQEMFTGAKAKFVPLNIEAFRRGMACISDPVPEGAGERARRPLFSRPPRFLCILTVDFVSVSAYKRIHRRIWRSCVERDMPQDPLPLQRAAGRCEAAGRACRSPPGAVGGTGALLSTPHRPPPVTGAVERPPFRRQREWYHGSLTFASPVWAGVREGLFSFPKTSNYF